MPSRRHSSAFDHCPRTNGGQGLIVFAAQAVQDDPDLLLRGILFARGALDVLDDLLGRFPPRSSCLSHVPLLGGYDEPETLPYQIPLFGPIGADVRHFLSPCSAPCRSLSGQDQVSNSKSRMPPFRPGMNDAHGIIRNHNQCPIIRRH